MIRYLLSLFLGGCLLLIASVLIERGSWHWAYNGVSPHAPVPYFSLQTIGYLERLLEQAVQEGEELTAAKLERWLQRPVRRAQDDDALGSPSEEMLLNQQRALLSFQRRGARLWIEPRGPYTLRLWIETQSGRFLISDWPIVDRELSRKGFIGVLLLFCLLIISAALVLFPRRQLLHLSKVAEKMGEGELSARATVSEKSLTGPLARTLNAMAGRLQELLEHRELLLQTLAHELRTPLARGRFIIERISDAEGETERREAIDSLDMELEDLERLLSLTLRGAIDGTLPSEPRSAVEVAPLIESLFRSLRRRYGEDVLPQLELTGLDTPVFVWVERETFRRAIENLLSNAARHAEARLHVKLSLVGGEDPAGLQLLQLSIDDDGEGIPAKSYARILQPFERLPGAPPRGLGLGLSLVSQVTRAHGYPVKIEASALGGARFVTWWPLHLGESSTPYSPALESTLASEEG